MVKKEIPISRSHSGASRQTVYVLISEKKHMAFILLNCLAYPDSSLTFCFN